MGLNTTRKVQEVIESSLKRNPADRKRFFVAHLVDGRQLSEHQCRWVDVPLHEIMMLELSMIGRKYQIERRHCPGFVEFIHFKTAERKLKSTPGIPDKTTSRCIGWTNGTDEIVIRVDEKTGERLGGVESYPLREDHLHPLSVLKRAPSSIMIPQPTIKVISDGEVH